MNHRSDFEQLTEHLKSEYPAAQVTIDVLASENVWCDIVLGTQWIEVQFVPGVGFGVSVFEEDTLMIPFTAPDHFFAESAAAQSFILQSLKRK